MLSHSFFVYGSKVQIIKELDNVVRVSGRAKMVMYRLWQVTGERVKV